MTVVAAGTNPDKPEWYNEQIAQQNCAPRVKQITVDYLVVGAGPGGGVTLDDISRAVRQSGQRQDSFAIIDRNDYIGGNLYDVPAEQPDGYGTEPRVQPPLMASLGGARINQLTLLNERRLAAELGMTVYYTPYRSRVMWRGRDLVCPAPTWGEPYSPGCSTDTRFLNGAFDGFTRYGDDPSFAAWCYLTHGPQYPCDYGDFEVPRHPVRGKECNRNLDGTLNMSPKADPSLECPTDACKHYPDWRSFIMDYLSPEYAEFLMLDNVGFFGDYSMANNACSYLDYSIREWQTATVLGYPLGGLSQMPKRNIARAQARGAQLYLSQAARCIERANSTGALYTVHTTDMTFTVRKFLFLNVPTHYLRTNLVGDNIYGSIGLALATARETKFPQAHRVAVVALQWPPNQAQWYYKYLDKGTGGWTYRIYGDSGCVSRLEIPDTPHFRLSNLMRPVYSDDRCRRLWERLIEAGQARLQAGETDSVKAYSDLLGQIMREFKHLFPNDTDITPPTRVIGKIFDAAWYFGSTQTSAGVDITNRELSQWAKAPLGTAERLCLIGEAYQIKYSGWVESALISSRTCLLDRFPQQTEVSTDVGHQLRILYAARDRIIKDDFDVLTKCPSPLKNEFCGPYGPFNADGTLVNGARFCAGSKGGRIANRAKTCRPW